MHKKIIKIGIDVRSIGKKQTGDETYILNLVQQLALIDLNNEYYLFTDSNNEKEISQRISLPNNFKIVKILPKNKYLWTMFLLPLKALKLKLDILHVLYITPIFIPGKTKLITTIHDLSWRYLPWTIKNKDLFFLAHSCQLV